MNKTLCLCAGIVGFMIMFTMALIPLYNTFCQVTGLNGKVDLSIAAALPDGIVQDRWITVEFIVNQHPNMPWEFKPQHITMRARPGELISTGYFAHNKSSKTIIAQAIPSITPFYTAQFFKKVECFCFSQQVLGPGQSANLPLRFYLDPKIPDKVKRLTLSYTLFDVTNGTEVLCYDCEPHPT